MKFLVFGIIQGLTEFLPISSSGHLFLLQRLIRVGSVNLPFFVFLHLATLLAIIVFLFGELKLFLKGRFFFWVFLITLISGVLGLAIRFYLREVLDSKFMLAFCFLANAGILLGIPASSGTRSIGSMNFKDACFLGLLQGFSPLPGISRSGITIAGLLKRGFKRSDAFTIAFLMALPIIAGAFFIEFKELSQSSLSFKNMTLGFVAAFISGLLALSLVKRVLNSAKFRNFAYYCMFLSLVSIIL